MAKAAMILKYRIGNSYLAISKYEEIVISCPRFIVRVKITLASRKREARLPLDYQFALASLIYVTLGDASAAFAAKLHDEGFRVEKRMFFSKDSQMSRRVLRMSFTLNTLSFTQKANRREQLWNRWWMNGQENVWR
jgi:hypothetical protein